MEHYLTSKDREHIQILLDDFKRRKRVAPPRRQPPRESEEAPLFLYCAAEVPAFGCVREVSFAVSSTTNQRIATVEKPSTTFSRTYLLNGPAVITSNNYGSAQRKHYQISAYDTGTPAVGETWGPKPSQFTLSKNYPGYRVIGVIDSTAKLALVVPEPIDKLLVKAPTSAKVAYNASGTFNIYVGPESSPVDSTMTLSCLVTGADIFRGKYAHAVFRNGSWVVEQVAKTVRGVLAGSLSQGGSATVNVGSDTVTAYDDLMKSGASAIASGKKVYISWFDDDKKWYVIGAECA